MYPHRIRLRGPWECEPVRGSTDAPLPSPRRVTMPGRWAEAGLPGFAGLVRFRRRFGYPGRIDAGERVWLTCAGLEGSAEVSLNGQHLGTHGRAFEHEVTSLLQPRNELVIDLEGSEPAGLWGEVALEVRRTAYLRNVCFSRDGERWRATAEVVGEAEGPLELYLIVGRHTAAYQLLDLKKATPPPGPLPETERGSKTTGEAGDESGSSAFPPSPKRRGGWGEGSPSLPVELVGEPAADGPVRLELVQGAVVWFSAEG